MELNDNGMINIENGQLVCCTGNIGEFNSEVTMYVSHIEQVDLSVIDEKTLALLYPSVENPEQLKAELRNLVESVENTEMKLLLEYVLFEKLWDQFIKETSSQEYSPRAHWWTFGALCSRS